MEAVVAENCPAKVPSDDWDAKAVELWAANMTGRDDFSVAEVDHDDDPAVLSEALEAYLEDVFASKSEQLGEPVMKMLEGPGHAAHDRHALDGAPPGDGLSQGRYRPARVRPARPAGGVKERGVQRVPEPDCGHVRGLSAHAVAAPGGCEAGGSRRWRRTRARLDGKVSYSSPEQALEQTGVGAARKQAARVAERPAAPPKPAAAKP